MIGGLSRDSKTRDPHILKKKTINKTNSYELLKIWLNFESSNVHKVLLAKVI
jgi:hypothetical protein